MAPHSVRRLFGLLNFLNDVGNACLDRVYNDHRQAKPADDPCFGGAGSVADMAGKREEQHSVDDAQVGDDLSRYRDYGMRISHDRIDISDANSWLAGHLQNSSLEKLNSHTASFRLSSGVAA